MNIDGGKIGIPADPKLHEGIRELLEHQGFNPNNTDAQSLNLLILYYPRLSLIKIRDLGLLPEEE